MTETVTYEGIEIPTRIVTRNGPREWPGEEPDDLLVDDEFEPATYAEANAIRRSLWEENGLMNARWSYLRIALVQARRESGVKELRRQWLAATQDMDPRSRHDTDLYRAYEAAREPFVQAINANRARWRWYEKLYEAADDGLEAEAEELRAANEAARKQREAEARRQREDAARKAREAKEREAKLRAQAKAAAAERRNESEEERARRTEGMRPAAFYSYLRYTARFENVEEVAHMVARRFGTGRLPSLEEIRQMQENPFELMLINECGFGYDDEGRAIRREIIETRREQNPKMAPPVPQPAAPEPAPEPAAAQAESFEAMKARVNAYTPDQFAIYLIDGCAYTDGNAVAYDLYLRAEKALERKGEREQVKGMTEGAFRAYLQYDCRLTDKAVIQRVMEMRK